jgi:hypothetical protein
VKFRSRGFKSDDDPQEFEGEKDDKEEKSELGRGVEGSQCK